MKNFRCKRLTGLFFSVLLFACFSIQAAGIGDYRSWVSYGNWNDATSWQFYNGSGWVLATLPPDTSDNVLVGSNTELVINGTAVCKHLTTAAAVGKVQLSFLPNSALTVYGNATFKDNGDVGLTGVPVTTTIPIIFSVKGQVKIQGAARLKIKYVNLFLENDFTLENGSFEGGGEAAKNNKVIHFIGGNLLLKKGVFILSTGSDPSYQIDGAVSIMKGAEMTGISGNSGAPVLNIQDGITTENSGVFRACDNSMPKKNTMFYINFTNDSNWNRQSILSVGAVPVGFASLWRFTVLQGRRIRLRSDLRLGGLSTITSYTAFTVERGAVLNTDTFKIYTVGSASDSRFLLNTDALLEIGHAQGISNMPEQTGAIQTNKRKYSETAFYGYTGSSNQITGKGLPPVIKKLIINNTGPIGSNTVFLSNPYLSIGGNNCQIIRGIFDVDTNTFTGHNCIFTMQGGGLKLDKTSATVLLPELKGAYILEGGTIELSGNGPQVIRGAVAYFNLTLSGNNIPGSSFKFPSSHLIINNQLEIRDNVILDAIDGVGNAVSITGPGGLLMFDNSWFRMKKLNATLPELKATAPGTDYKLKGGTIELYGTDSNQTHSLNGSKGLRGADIGYFNVVINARALNAKEANVVLQSSTVINNSFTVKAPASFQISNAFSLKGPGSFELAPGATLQYGSPQGISNIPNRGNIRLTGKKTFSRSSNFGLVGSLPMETGNLLPDTVHNLFINKKNVVLASLSSNLAVLGAVHFIKGILETKDNALLKILVGAQVSGASDESHVTGPVVKLGSSPFTFPVGNRAYFRPIGVSASNSAMAMFKAAYFNLDPTGLFGSKLDKGLDHISQCEYWELQAEKVGGELGITLSWNENSCGVDAPEDLRVAHFNPLQLWENDSNLSYSRASGSSGTVQSKFLNIPSGRAPFTLASHSSSNPLPISLLRFEARLNSGNALLTWVTASETNSNFFSIERSGDGIFYNRLGYVKGAGTTFEKHEYVFKDPGLLPGNYYYRLRQTDFNGASSLQGPVVLTVPENRLRILKAFWEGPTLIVSIMDKQEATRKITLVDPTGQVLYTSEASDKDFEIRLDPDTASGIYLLRVASGDEIAIRKIIL